MHLASYFQNNDDLMLQRGIYLAFNDACEFTIVVWIAFSTLCTILLR